jgi:hypothetical protein
MTPAVGFRPPIGLIVDADSGHRDVGSKRGPEASDKPSDNACRRCQMQRDVLRHRDPSDLR